MQGDRGRPAHYRPAERRCLGGCDKVFWSPGPGVRVCPKCRVKLDTKRLSKWQEKTLKENRG